MIERRVEAMPMATPAQALAYAKADFTAANTLFVETFAARFPNAQFARVVDLGCGPGDIAIRFSRRYPQAKIDAVDANPEMLEQAQIAIDDTTPLPNIALHRVELPDVQRLPCDYEVLLCNSVVHQLATPDALWQSIRQLGHEGAYVLIMDLARPESDQAAKALVERYARDEPAQLQTDFYRALLAAYTPEEMMSQLHGAGLTSLGVAAPSDRHWIAAGRL